MIWSQWKSEKLMSFTQWLSDRSKIILFDGAMGTQLMEYKLDPGKLPDMLNFENPDVVQNVLASYYDSGADMVQTCTFSSNLVNLERQNLGNLLQKINTEAINNIRAVKPPNGKLVVGDIGPSGEFRPPVGNASGDQWKNGFLQQVEFLETIKSPVNTIYCLTFRIRIPNFKIKFTQ